MKEQYKHTEIEHKENPIVQVQKNLEKRSLEEMGNTVRVQEELIKKLKNKISNLESRLDAVIHKVRALENELNSRK